MKKIEKKTNTSIIDEHFDQKYEALGTSSKYVYEDISDIINCGIGKSCT